MVGFPVHVFPILDFGEFGNYKTELVSRIYSGAKLADCQRGPILETWNPTCRALAPLRMSRSPQKTKYRDKTQKAEDKRQKVHGVFLVVPP